MKYEFRLQKVLEHRQRLEDEARRNYMVARTATEDALADLEHMYQQIDEARGRAASGFTRAMDLQQVDAFIEGQKIRIDRQRLKIRELKQEEERLQDLLVVAAKEKKTLEKLDERSYKAFLAEVERRERAEDDELAVMRYKRGEGP